MEQLRVWKRGAAHCPAGSSKEAGLPGMWRQQEATSNLLAEHRELLGLCGSHRLVCHLAHAQIHKCVCPQYMHMCMHGYEGLCARIHMTKRVHECVQCTRVPPGSAPCALAHACACGRVPATLPAFSVVSAASARSLSPLFAAASDALTAAASARAAFP